MFITVKNAQTHRHETINMNHVVRYGEIMFDYQIGTSPEFKTAPAIRFEFDMIKGGHKTIREDLIADADINHVHAVTHRTLLKSHDHGGKGK